MAMTMTQKIIAAHCGCNAVEAGQLVECGVDLILGNDITAPVAINEIEKAGADKLFDSDKIALVLDHFTPNKDIKAAQQCKMTRQFARRHGIKNFFDVGEMGIEHALLPEKGLVAPGELVVGADSHTCTYGALGAFSTGVGSTDIAAAMITGSLWFKVPGALKVKLTGGFRGLVSGKDLILHLIGLIGVDGALYQSLEFCGEGVSAMTMDDRFTVANMAIEAGTKNGIFPVDEKTLEYCRAHGCRTDAQIYEADSRADYEREVEIDLSKLDYTVAMPSLPSNTRTVAEAAGVSIDQSVIGSCTNGRLSDMRTAAKLMKGRKVADGVRCIVIPATQKIYLECIKEGLAEIFVEAGAVFSTPTCGPCLGGHMGVLADGERAVSTTNRNFVGRMGHPGSEVVLASPAVAAASALTGQLTSPESL